jgi:pyruvate dehydrogenase E2 component (dihydrolipoamide acetyltransferase)
MAEFVMPSLGSDMEAGTLVTWLKKPGDGVERGDIIAEVDTDKGLIEVEVFTSGVVERLLVAEGTKVPVGTPLAVIREPGAEAPPPASEPAPPPAPLPEPLPVALGSLHSSSSSHAPRLRISPSARLRARELGVNPEGVRGTGPGGAITRADIESAAQRPAATLVGAPPADAAIPTTSAKVPSEVRRSSGPAGVLSPDAAQRMRQAIAAAMARSNREIPHYYVSHTLDVEPALAHLERVNAGRTVPERLLPAALWIKAVAVLLRDYPELNGRWENERLVQNSSINVGMAIALRGGGLVIPAILDTDTLSLDTIMQRLGDLVERSRRGQLRSSELSAGTITLTSLGDRGVEAVFGVIYPPQVALIGLGSVCTRPWVTADGVVPRRLLHASLAADHRASDGHRGSLFLAALERLLKEPEKL